MTIHNLFQAQQNWVQFGQKLYLEFCFLMKDNRDKKIGIVGELYIK